MALQELDIDPDDVTTEDFSSLRYICEVVSRRASFMASAGITALLKKMDYRDVVIAIDGSLFRYVYSFCHRIPVNKRTKNERFR